ncbi:TPA: hypothetical protein ACIAPS_004637 [Salmonella enterica subsp. enterica serovar Bovismorbificans]
MRSISLYEMDLVSGGNGCPIEHYDAGMGNGQTYYINPQTGNKVMDPTPGSPGYSSSANYPAVNNAFCNTGPHAGAGRDPNGYISGAINAGVHVGTAILNGILHTVATGRI